MHSRSRLAWIVVVTTLSWGCNRLCRPGTVFLTVDLSDTIRGEAGEVRADSIEVSVDGRAPSSAAVKNERVTGETPIEVDLADQYQPGATAHIAVALFLKGAPIARGVTDVELSEECTSARLSLNNPIALNQTTLATSGPARADGRALIAVTASVRGVDDAPLVGVPLFLSFDDPLIAPRSMGMTNGEGLGQLELTSETAGTLALTLHAGAIDGVAIATTDAVFTPLVGTLPTLSAVPADGQTEISLDLFLHDVENAAVAGIPIFLESVGSLEAAANIGITDAQGIVHSDFTSKIAETRDLAFHAFRADGPIVASTTITFSSLVASVQTSNSALADGQTPITLDVHVESVDGDPLDGIAIYLESRGNAVTTGAIGVTDASGYVHNELRSAIVETRDLIFHAFTADGPVLGAATVTFTPPPPRVFDVLVTQAPGTRCAQVTFSLVQLQALPVDVVLSYALDNDTVFHPITGGVLSALTTASDGAPHSFAWDLNDDVRGERLTRVQVTATIPNGPVHSGIAQALLDNRIQFKAVGSQLRTGRAPNTITTGDFNKDGKLDLAITNAGDATIGIYLGDGTGAFSAAAPIQGVGDPVELIASDFDNDGASDLAVLSGTTRAVDTYMSRDATMIPSFHKILQFTARGLAVGDTNGDGNEDLFASSSLDLTPMLGGADGTFQTRLGLVELNGLRAIAAGDINGDGVADVVGVLANNTLAPYISGGDVPPATGQFNNAPSIPLGTAGDRIVLARLDANTTLDIAVTSPSTNSVRTFFGNGNASFAAQPSIPMGNNPRALLVIDLDEDSIPEIITADYDDDTISIRKGNGDGTFQERFVLLVGDGPRAIAAARFNGDTKIDLAIVNERSENLTVLLNRGALRFSNTRTVAPPTSVTVADLDGDGELDVLATTADVGPTAEIALFRGHGDGSLTREWPRMNLGASYATYLTDLNENSVPDLVTVGRGGSFVWSPGLGGGSFDPAIAFPTAGNEDLFGLALADIDNDNHVDVVLADTGSNTARVYIGMGDGSLALLTTLATEQSPVDALLEDFDNDGELDLAIVNQGNDLTGAGAANGYSIQLFRGFGDGTFALVQRHAVGALPTRIVAGDADHDGYSDLWVSNSGSSTVSWLHGVGDGTFAPPVSLPVGSTPVDLAIVDLNGDGHLDIAVVNRVNLVLLYGNGDGTFAPASSQSVGTDPYSVGVGDINHDGAVDVVVGNRGDRQIGVLLNHPLTSCTP